VEVVRPGAALADATAGSARPDLVIDLRSRQTHVNSNGLLTFVSVITLTLVPMVTEQSFAIDVAVRDPSGFVLASDTYEGRMVEYVGVGLWLVRQAAEVLDRTGARPFDASKEMSNDLYAQLCQLGFHARVRRDVLRGFAPSSGQAAAP